MSAGCTTCNIYNRNTQYLQLKRPRRTCSLNTIVVKSWPVVRRLKILGCEAYTCGGRWNQVQQTSTGCGKHGDVGPFLCRRDTTQFVSGVSFTPLPPPPRCPPPAFESRRNSNLPGADVHHVAYASTNKNKPAFESRRNSNLPGADVHHVCMRAWALQMLLISSIQCLSEGADSCAEIKNGA